LKAVITAGLLCVGWIGGDALSGVIEEDCICLSPLLSVSPCCFSQASRPGLSIAAILETNDTSFQALPDQLQGLQAQVFPLVISRLSL